jgi:hypothetical protein
MENLHPPGYAMIAARLRAKIKKTVYMIFNVIDLFIKTS